MSTTTAVRIGRQLDDRGEPVPDTGFEIDPDGPIADYLRRREGPLVSNPVTGEWVARIEADAESKLGLGIFGPHNAGPPRHYHVGYVESFEVVAGEFVFETDDTKRTLGPGDAYTVQPDVVHTFQNVSDEVGATATTTSPPADTLDVIKTLFGLAHEGRLNDRGQPPFLQAMVTADEMADDTVFTSPPPAVSRALATVFAPIGRWRGYRARYPRYQDDAFWETHAEQPPF